MSAKIKNKIKSGETGHRALYAYHPTWGYSFRKNINARFVSTDSSLASIKVVTNDEGFRNNFNANEFLTTKNIKVLVIGCSFAAGHGVENEQRLFDLISIISKNISFYNAALSGSAHDQQYLILKDIITKTKPDWICVAPYSGCALRNTRSYRSFYNPLYGGLSKRPKPYFEIFNKQLILKNSPVPKWEKLSADENIPNDAPLLAHKILSKLNHLALQLNFGKPKPETEIYTNKSSDGYILTTKILEKIIDCAMKNNAKTLFMPLPSHHDLQYRNPAYIQFFEQFAKIKRCPFVNVIDGLKLINNDQRKNIFIQNDGHYSPFGHKVIADFIAPQLQNILDKNK